LTELAHAPFLFSQVVAENSTGRLVEMTLKAGDEDAPHDHPKHYMYVVSGGKLAITDWSSGAAGGQATVDLPTGAPPIMPSGDARPVYFWKHEYQSTYFGY